MNLREWNELNFLIFREMDEKNMHNLFLKVSKHNFRKLNNLKPSDLPETKHTFIELKPNYN